MPDGRKDVTVRAGRHKLIFEEENLNLPRSDEDAVEEFVARVRRGSTSFPADLLNQLADQLDEDMDDRRKEILKLRKASAKAAAAGRKRQEKSLDAAREKVEEFSDAKANENVIYSEPNFMSSDVPPTGGMTLGVPEQGPASAAAKEAQENPEAAQHNVAEGGVATDAQEEERERKRK